jgi:ADP-ribose pyrophosphatase
VIWGTLAESRLTPSRTPANRLGPWNAVDMTENWHLLSERPGSAGYITVTTRRYSLPDGTEADWDIIGPAKSVAVLALTPTDEVVLARQFRPGPARVLDEMPGGLVDQGEEVLTAGARELLEETGFAGQIELAGRS